MFAETSSGLLWATWIAAFAAWVGCVFSWWRSYVAGEAAKRAEHHKTKVLAVDIAKANSAWSLASDTKEIAEQAKKDAKEAKDLIARDDQALLISIRQDLTRNNETLTGNLKKLLESISTDQVYRVPACTENTKTATLVQDAYAAMNAFNKLFLKHDKINSGNAWGFAKPAVKAALAQIEKDDAFNQACSCLEETESDA